MWKYCSTTSTDLSSWTGNTNTYQSFNKQFHLKSLLHVDSTRLKANGSDNPCLGLCVCTQKTHLQLNPATVVSVHQIFCLQPLTQNRFIIKEWRKCYSASSNLQICLSCTFLTVHRCIRRFVVHMLRNKKINKYILDKQMSFSSLGMKPHAAGCLTVKLVTSHFLNRTGSVMQW